MRRPTVALQPFSAVTPFSKLVDDRLQVIRQRGGELDSPAVARVRERDPVGVKERAVQRAEHAVVGREMTADAAVDGVTDDRVADAVQVDADLVLTTGGDGNRRKCQAAETLGAGHSCDGRPGAARAGGLVDQLAAGSQGHPASSRRPTRSGSRRPTTPA